MDQQRVDLYLAANQTMFPEEQTGLIRERLLALPENRFSQVKALQLKQPKNLLLFSIFLGVLGIDRFLLGDYAMGILKLLTLGFCGVMAIVDWFSASERTRAWNLNLLMETIL